MARVFETDITLNAQRELRLADADSSAYVGFKAPATITTNRIWTLPSADGTSGQVLSTNGSGVLSWATAGGGGGLTHFVESEETASPNATVPVDALTATDASFANIDVALVAKGTGATLAQVPDGTAVGGNKRGTYATDLQKNRNSASQVASGNNSIIAGGYRNTASGSNSIIVGGANNTASASQSVVVGGDTNTASSSLSFVGGGQSNRAQTGTYAAVCGGSDNTVSGNSAFIGGGNTNTASTNYSFVGGGQSNLAQTNTHATVCGGNGSTASGGYSFVGGGASHTVSGSTATVCGGNTNTASATGSTVCGGRQNTANGDHSFVGGGRRGTTRSIAGYQVFPACDVPIADALGISQSALLLLGRQTTDATATVLTSNSSAAGTTNQVILANNSAYSFSGEVIAGVTAAGNTARWTIDGAIKRGANAASTVMVGTPTVTMTHNDAGAATWVVAVTADTTNGGIAVTVTGAAATTIRWVCKINTTEMTY
jgi:hypothetical protein